MSKSTLKQAISEAGGIKAVSLATGKSYEAVRKWTKNGLPRTEWTGETQYSVVIASLQNQYTVDDLLGSTRAA
jgi:hypothetical protein